VTVPWVVDTVLIVWAIELPLPAENPLTPAVPVAVHEKVVLGMLEARLRLMVVPEQMTVVAGKTNTSGTGLTVTV